MTPAEAVANYRRNVAGARMGIAEPEDVDQAWRVAREACESAIRDAREALADLAVLQTHTCDWNDDDYCRLCGADGRA